jgi:2-aminoadipate transaminase
MTPTPYSRRAQDIAPASLTGDLDGLIWFGSGDAYPEILPDLGEIAHKAARDFRRETLQYAARGGLAELREWIAGYLAGEGVRIGAESILVVNGAKHGIELACKLFLDPGDAIVVGRPTYQSALGIFRSWQIEFLEVGLDEDGLDVDELETRLREWTAAGRRAPKLVYEMPEFHNPTGVTLSAARRRRLVDLAERHGMVILEDDPYRRIRFEGTPVAPIQALDPAGGRVIGLGTFSKLLAPGIRVGWVAAAPDVVGRMAALKADGGTCPLTQRIIVEYCRAGRFEPHIAHAARTYAGQRDVMAAAVSRALPGASFRRPSGGYYLWVRLPEDVDADALLAAAHARGVDFLPASRFYASTGPRNYLRLAYSYASPAELIDGVERVGQALAGLGAAR